ncbi:bifunctional diaminohydroxyphosphoribosylaminopyrimidine deaminase/5-amino-6-(5-phosphoribosylamino)uracil reductase, partial [Vibrio cholerae O1]|nr:bifunctional diaminohydroxyphosphoribosylaminopyrimidine deaminase/5-amino-6-(5-phosphoribosylamino)uracil reductase [Vibrio cholerae O1]
NPNPQVGAIIVKNDKIIGEGYHEQYGQAHAERSALSSCIESPQGADMYVTLEPCAHQGRQPPCFKAIIDNK